MSVRTEAIDSVKMMMEDIKKGHPIYVIIRSRAHTGMSRTVDLYVPFVDKGTVRTLWMTPHVARAIGRRLTRSEHISVRGCGYDAQKAIVRQFSEAIFDDPEHLICEVL